MWKEYCEEQQTVYFKCSTHCFLAFPATTMCHLVTFLVYQGSEDDFISPFQVFFVGHCRSELANTFINCGNGHRCENSLQHAFSHIPTALDDTLCLKIAANTCYLGTRITFTSTHPTNASFFELLNVFHPLAVCDVMQMLSKSISFNSIQPHS